MSENKINHEVGFPIFIACTFAALWVYCLIASYFGWIEAILWGGKAMLNPIFGSITLAFSAPFLYGVMALLWKQSIFFDYRQLTLVAFVFGFSLLPTMELLAVIKQKEYLSLPNPVVTFMLWIVLCMTTALVLNMVSINIRKLFSDEIDL